MNRGPSVISASRGCGATRLPPHIHGVGMRDVGKRLLSACERGDLPEVRDLIENGAPLDAKDGVRARHAQSRPARANLSHAHACAVRGAVWLDAAAPRLG